MCHGPVGAHRYLVAPDSHTGLPAFLSSQHHLLHPGRLAGPVLGGLPQAPRLRLSQAAHLLRAPQHPRLGPRAPSPHPAGPVPAAGAERDRSRRWDGGSLLTGVFGATGRAVLVSTEGLQSLWSHHVAKTPVNTACVYLETHWEANPAELEVIFLRGLVNLPLILRGHWYPGENARPSTWA